MRRLALGLIAGLLATAAYSQVSVLSNPPGTAGGGGPTTLTGDATGSGTGTVAVTIPAGTITLGKMANLAANSVLGNNTGSPATPLALTTAQTKTLLAIANTDVSGLGTASTGATGTSGHTIPFLDGVNTFSGATTFSGNVSGTGATNQFGATSGTTDSALNLFNTNSRNDIFFQSIVGTQQTDGDIYTARGSGLFLDSTQNVSLRLSGTTVANVNSTGLNIGSGKNLQFNTTPIFSTSGVLLAAGFPALTGDVTTAGGALATTLGTVAGAVKTSSATAGIGYATGAGGTVTQLTSRVTGVTLNKLCGAITLFSVAGSATSATFTVTDSSVAATDVVILNQKSGTDKYILSVTALGTGSFNISSQTTGGTTVEAPVFQFCVVKGVNA